MRLFLATAASLAPERKIASVSSRVNCMPVFEAPAQTRKGRGFCTGFGKDSQSFKVKYLPSILTDSSTHSRLIAWIHSWAKS